MVDEASDAGQGKRTRMKNKDADNKHTARESFIGELSRRHVVGSAVAYAVASWALIQVVDVLAPAFNAPDWTIRALTTVLILLFPLVVVLSWEYNVSWSGIEKTEGDFDRGVTARHWFRRTIVAVISATSLGAIAWVWWSGILTDSTFDAAVDTFPKIIAVEEFQAFAAPESEWLGEGIANLVRDNLTQSQYLRVVSPRRWKAISAKAKEGDVLEVAADADIRYLLQGEIIGNRGGHVLSVRLTDTSNGEQLEASTFEVGEDTSLLERATAIAQTARAKLRVPGKERVDLFAADFASEHPSAYRAFIDALDYWTNYEFKDAERLFRAAIELQPDYAMARYYLAWNLVVQDRYDESVQFLSAAMNSDKVSDRDREYLQALSYYIESDFDAAAKAYGELVDRYPSDTEARAQFAEVLSLRGDYESAIEGYRDLSRIEPEVHVGWSGLAFANIQAGNYDDARPAVEEFARIAPNNPNAYVLRGDLHRAQGDLAAARKDYLTAIEKGPDLQEAVVSLGLTEYLLGQVDAALDTLDKLIRNTSAIPRYRIDAAFAAGGILNSLGRGTEHIVYLELLEPELSASEIFGAKGLADRAYARLQLGQSGDDTARLIDRAIEESPGVATRYLFMRGLLELQNDQFDAVRRTAKEIRALALPPEDPDRTEDMAADYLLGHVALASSDLNEAYARSNSVRDVDGYQYRVYGLLHAQVLLAMNRLDEAAAELDKVGSRRDRVSPRLDLELDRAFGRLVLADVYRARGDTKQAERLIGELRQLWEGADAGFTGRRRLDVPATRALW